MAGALSRDEAIGLALERVQRQLDSYTEILSLIAHNANGNEEIFEFTRRNLKEVNLTIGKLFVVVLYSILGSLAKMYMSKDGNPPAVVPNPDNDWVDLVVAPTVVNKICYMIELGICK